MARRFGLTALLVFGGVLFAAQAEAAEEKPEAASSESGASEDSPAADDAPAESKEGEGEGEGDAKEEKDEKASDDAALVADAEKGDSPVETPGKTYRFIGARYRFILVPKFIIGLFSDGGTTVGVHSFGAEFAVRKDAFEYNFAISYAPYSMDPTPFKAKSDGPDAWELVESRVKVIYLTADFLWSHDFSPELALNYGMGAGFGFVFGPLYRNQAHLVGNEYVRCTAPNTFPPYCGSDNDHYNNYEEPGWGGGGSKPVIFPWLAVQTGLRYKPHRNFATRLDVGFGLSGFFFGLGADYGL